MKNIVIMINGKAGAGKDTLAKYLKEYITYKGITSYIVSFSQSIKQLSQSIGWDCIKDAKGRQLLIDIGKAGVKYNPYCWVEQAIKDLFISETIWNSNNRILIIPDLRFVHELRYFLTDNRTAVQNLIVDMIYVINIQRDDHLEVSQHHNPKHVTETELVDRIDLYDVIVNNNSTLENLQTKVSLLALIEDNEIGLFNGVPIEEWYNRNLTTNKTILSNRKVPTI